MVNGYISIRGFHYDGGQLAGAPLEGRAKGAICPEHPVKGRGYNCKLVSQNAGLALLWHFWDLKISKFENFPGENAPQGTGKSDFAPGRQRSLREPVNFLELPE